jgi:hypothetical protein
MALLLQCLRSEDRGVRCGRGGCCSSASGSEEVCPMRTRFKLIWASLLAIAVPSTPGLTSAHAQMAMSGGGRSLGGYGASTISSY